MVTYPKLVLDNIAPTKLETFYGSSIRKFEAGSGTSIRTFEAYFESSRKSSREICPLSSITVHLIVRSENRYAFRNHSSWQSSDACPGPARCLVKGRIGVGAQLTRSTPDDGHASSRACGNSVHASGHSATYSRHALGCSCFESHIGKHGACFWSLGNFPEAIPKKSLLRVEHVKTTIACFGSCGYILQSLPWTIFLKQNSEQGLGTSIRTFEACFESRRKSSREICLPSSITVHLVVRSKNRYAFGNRSSFQ